MIRYIFSLLLLLDSFVTYAQSYPKDYFRSPLDIPLFLSGNFGELRSNHFHAGLDIKTQGVEGQKVYAIADGFVSRIKVSPYGYGTAIYITHPNGYTSVYGHLKKYSERIATVVKDEQYKRESFSIQFFPDQFQIQVKKGEVIAYSGNTGGSGGPHLHFEIRDTKTEHPINPLFFGFDIKDNVKPDIYAVTLYPLNDKSLINGSNFPKRIKVSGSNGIYRLLNKSSIKAHGSFGLGVETVDRMSGTGNRYGLHNIKLLHNQELIYEHQIDEFAFHEGRYINSHIDYSTYIKFRRRVQKSFISPGNKLRIYKTIKNQGKLQLNDDQIHKFTYQVADLNGNTSELTFNINAIETGRIQEIKEKEEKIIKYFPFNQRNTFIKDEILVDIPKGLLYENLYFEYERTEPLENTISPVYWLHNNKTPLHSHMTVSIKADHLSEQEKRKAIIVSTTDGKHLYAEGGKWKENNITVKTRSFGGYSIALDTIPPKITPVNIYNNAKMNGKWSVSIKIDDDLSGINTYRGTIDDKWVLMQYDAKRDMLVYYFDEKVLLGDHIFRLIVKDAVGNQSEFSANFSR